MRKHLIIGVVQAIVLMLTAPAMALDTEACNNFPHNWGPDTVCLGKYTPEDMGEWIDPDGDGIKEWEWYPSFLNDPYMQNSFSMWNGDFDQLIPTKNDSVEVGGYRLDNRHLVSGNLASRVVLEEAQIGGIGYPSIWKMEVGPETWGDYCTPCIGVYVDWVMRPECEEMCDQWGCDFGDESVCSWYPSSPNYVWDSALFDLVGARPVGVGDVAYMDLLKDGKVEATYDPARWEENNYRFMTYNTGDNFLYAGSWGQYTELYSAWNYGGLIPLGDYELIVHMSDGTDLPTLPLSVVSDRVMPTVSAWKEGLTYTKVKVNEKGKVKFKDKTKEITVVNITAREVDGQLIVQWTVPDLALQPPLPDSSGIRLRIFIGDGWITTTIPGHPVFLWIDAPVQTGTIVVPEAVWIDLKQKMIDDLGRNSVEIGGMYREQFDHYSNRGYMEAIEYTF